MANIVGKATSSISPFGILSRLFYQALANCGQKPQDIITFVRQYVTRKGIKNKNMLSSDKSKAPSEASVQQEIQTVQRAILNPQMTLKTLFQAAQVVNACKIEMTLTLHFDNGVSVSSSETVLIESLSDLDKEKDDDQNEP